MTDQTARLLAEIPALAAQLRPFLIPSNNPGSDGPRPAPTSRPPLNVDLLDLIAGRPVAMWAHLLVDEWENLGRTLEQLPDGITNTITTTCAWLTLEAPFITEHHPDYPAAIATIYSRYRTAAGDPEETTYTCPDCGWTVEPRDDSAWWNCTGCPRTWTLGAEISRLMERQADVMTLGQIAEKLGIPHPTLRRWARTRFASVGTRHGRPLYDLRIVQASIDRLKATA